MLCSSSWSACWRWSGEHSRGTRLQVSFICILMIKSRRRSSFRSLTSHSLCSLQIKQCRPIIIKLTQTPWRRYITFHILLAPKYLRSKLKQKTEANVHVLWMIRPILKHEKFIYTCVWPHYISKQIAVGSPHDLLFQQIPWAVITSPQCDIRWHWNLMIQVALLHRQ